MTQAAQEIISTPGFKSVRSSSTRLKAVQPALNHFPYKEKDLEAFVEKYKGEIMSKKEMPNGGWSYSIKFDRTNKSAGDIKKFIDEQNWEENPYGVQRTYQRLDLGNITTIYNRGKDFYHLQFNNVSMQGWEWKKERY